MNLDKQKLFLSRVDNMFKKFTIAKNVIFTIKYNLMLKVLAKVSGSELQVGKQGFTYETAHLINIANRGRSLIYSSKIVKWAKNNLKFRKNSVKLSNYRFQIVGYDFKEVQKDFKVFAYFVETKVVNSKKGNELFKEICKLICSQRKN